MSCTWLFVATLPNSGSTALAGLLVTAPGVGAIEGRAEGKWLTPELSRSGARWNPDAPVDYDEVRRVWLGAAAALDPAPAVIIDKSPANLCRMRPLRAAFADMPTRLVVFTREPVAVCASWARRYSAYHVIREWEPALEGRIPDEAAFFTALGDICGRRMAMIRDLLPDADLVLSYEDVAADPAAARDRLAQAHPIFGRIDTAAPLAVKEYAHGPFVDLNVEQRAMLFPRQRRWILEGLEPHRGDIEALGYGDSFD